MAHIDERWLRLALVVHEASTDAIREVLEKAISTKHADLATKSFEEKLQVALTNNKIPLQKFLLNYEYPNVFPTSAFPGTYESFDVGIVSKLIQFFVGKADWDRGTGGLPDVENLHTFDLTTASQLALVKLIKEYRNYVFHHPARPSLTEVEFNSHYDNLLLILDRLGYDVTDLCCYRTGSLDYNKRLLVESLNKLVSAEISTLRDELVSKKDMADFSQLVNDRLKCIERGFNKINVNMLTRDSLADFLLTFEELQHEIANTKERLYDLGKNDQFLNTIVRNLQDQMISVEQVKYDVSELKSRMSDLESSSAAELLEKATKDELINVREKFKTDIQELSEDIQTRSASANTELLEKVQNEMATKGELNYVREKFNTDIQALSEDIQTRSASENTERKSLAVEACWAANEILFSSRELDLFGDQIKGPRKDELMVSLATVDSSDVDAARVNSANEIQDLLTRSFKGLRAVAIHDIFKGDKIALVRGFPGAGKSTFCHFILKEWQAGRLWSKQFDFVFYINAPLLVTFLDEPPYNMQRVLKTLYPHVFAHISYEELKMFKCMIIADSIDECDVDKICAKEPSASFEEAIKKIIKSPENFHRIIVGRPHACDNVRLKLLKGGNFQFIEVVGFTSDQVREYVVKFCRHDQVRSENLWRRISDNSSLFAMSHLPIFANVLCNVLTENANVKIETQTELYVWMYFVLLTRHCKGKHSDEVKKGTFKEWFNNETLINALVSVSNMAYGNLTTGKIFFTSSDMEVKGIECTFVSPFVVRLKEYLSFSHLSCMEFFAAVHLFVSGVHLDQEIISQKRLRNVLPMLFGLLGAAVRNSDSAEILLDFIQPLIKKFKLRPIDQHPLSVDIGRSVFEMDFYHGLFVNLTFEFRNSQLLRGEDVYWENDAWLRVRHHHQLDALVYLLDNLIHSERTVGRLFICPTDDQLSMRECEKLRDCLKRREVNVNVLVLGLISLTSEQMEVFGEVCSLVSTVHLHYIHATTSELWEIFLQSVKKAKRNQTHRLKKMWIFKCNMNEAIRSELKELGIDV